MLFTVELVGDKAIIARLEAFPETVRVALRNTITRLAMLLQAKVQQTKLQGQVLHHRTGKLSASIEHAVAEDGNSIIGRVFSNGTVKYAAIHEFGFSGAEHVRSFRRRQTQVFGRAISPITVTVGPFDRQMKMPERSFLRSTLTENAAMIERQLTEAVVRALGGDDGGA